MLWVVQRLTLVMMLFHSVMGCCWHHSHECSCGHSSQGAACPVVAKDSHHGSCCGRKHSKPLVCQHQHPKQQTQTPENGPEQLPHQTRCEHGTCTFLVESSDVAVPEFEMLSVPRVEWERLLMQSATRPIHTDSEIVMEWGSAALRCAVLQVWRI